MSPEQFINQHYKDLQDAAKKISGNDSLWEELLAYTLDEFLHKKDLQNILDSGGGRWFCIKILMNSWKSTTSPFFHTYRKQNSPLEGVVIADDDEGEFKIQELYAKAMSELDKLPWYDKLLFKTFVDGDYTISSLARETGIPRTSISLTINRVRKHLKETLK